MALTSITQAEAQRAAASAGGWNASPATAQLYREALEYLLANRAQDNADAGSQLKFETLQTELTKVQSFLGVGAPRAFGRSRTLTASFPATGGVA